MKTNYIARNYVTLNGQVCMDLIDLGKGEYIVANNGQIQDARRKLNREEARAWYDGAAYKTGERP